jgi:dienelactone hydrolase
MHRINAFLLSSLLHLIPGLLVAQTNSSEAQRWLAGADIAPAFAAPSSRAAWEHERLKIRGELWQLLGKLPPRPKLPRVEVLSREDRGDYVVEKFQFDNGAGATVPGYLLLPKEISGKASAVLFCHWHGGEYEIGKEELFQARHMPEPPGPALARRGYVVLAIDTYCFGERNGRGPDGPAEKGADGEASAVKFNLWVGRTLWGMILRDDLMALDYLASRPEVDTDRLGVMGMSMGATRAWWLMALDDRIKTGVPICCLTRYQNIIEHGWLSAHSIYYYVPGMLNHFDTEAIISLIAPRPVLFLDGDSDKTSPVDGIHIIEAAVRPVYRLYGQEDNFESIVYAGQGHLCTPAMWQKTLEWLDARLKGGAAAPSERKHP